MTTIRPAIFLRSALLVGTLLTAPFVRGQASVETLESSALKVEVSSSPYSYRVVEKSTGEALLSESGGSWFTESKYSVRNAGNVVRADDSLQMTLHLEGTSTPAQASFRFSKPEVLEVTLTFNSGIPTQISEEFNDQGEHCYGI